eukprot:TRINITY_DN17480_c0_g1_i1.p1 TRINITY_DN17480_c0_g1~~TRINITY_DN17480_c0_g1_i1.p1  ORF type:complete len:440 (+),score=150.05 TRINITY_DN17480_c0_g1_i1:38-1357(+)
MEPGSGLLWGLEPFIHQVGGHSPLFCLDAATVCKPYEEREHSFYSSMPDCLQAYTPQFKGSMQVHITEDQDGYITLRGFPPNSYQNKHRQAGNNSKPKMRLKRCGSIEIESEVGDHCDQYFTDEKVKGEKLYNPWALKCHRDNLKKVGIHLLKAPSPTLDSPACQQYILLENLTSKLRHPCVLDLKVGTRQYGDGASASKKISKDAKVAKTTSGLLGLRLGGMQVYQVSLGRYICRTKNYGRGLSADGLKSALRQFFCNGLLVRTDVIQALLVKLSQLQQLLAGLDSYRFYTSSLLVTYDGSSSYQTGSLEWSPVPRNSFSTSSLLLIAGSDSCQARETGRARHKSAHMAQAQHVSDGPRKRSLSVSNDHSTTRDHKDRLFDRRELVDMRLIDFAHSTHRGLKDASVHEGPDQGLLFGLDSLVTILREIEQTAGRHGVV